MNISEQYQEKRLPFRAIAVNIEKLQVYMKWRRLQKEIDNLEKERNQYLTAPKSVAEIKKEIENCLKNYIAVTEGDLNSQIRLLQERKARVDEAVEYLIRIHNLKSVKREIEAIKTSDYSKGLPVVEREANIKGLADKIEKLRKAQKDLLPFGETVVIDEMSKYVALWQQTAPRFFQKCDAGGRYLNPNNEQDKALIKIYDELKLGDLPKLKLYKPMYLADREFSIPPAYGYLEK